MKQYLNLGYGLQKPKPWLI